LTVVEGVFRLVVTAIMPRSTFEVHTTNAVAAIRGTDWLGQVQRDATALVVLEGEVVVTHARPEVQGSVQLTAGMGTDVVGQQPPAPPKQWGAARLQALLTATTLP
jgi:ferric-dicitrate binding protein FerR (iron transport regulator)